MPDYRKLDEIDMVVIDEPWTPEERKAFSEYLKSEKAKQARNQKQKLIHLEQTKAIVRAKR